MLRACGVRGCEAVVAGRGVVRFADNCWIAVVADHKLWVNFYIYWQMTKKNTQYIGPEDIQILLFIKFS